MIGAGPAGYTAAIRMGQMGVDVTLAGPEIGGTCLHHGCIPIKGLIRMLDLAADVKQDEAVGVRTQGIEVSLSGVHAHNAQIIRKLETGIRSLLSASGVQLFEGTCAFTSSTTAAVRSHGSTQHVRFKKAVIATGVHYAIPEGVKSDGRRIVSPYAVGRLEKAPGNAVVLGDGVAGTTMASLLSAMGTKVAIAFKSPSLIPVLDDDILQPAMKFMANEGIRTFPQATWQVSSDRNTLTIQSGGKAETLSPDLIVICPPVKPNIGALALDRTKVRLNDKGFVAVDANYRTSDPSIYAIGDLLGGRRNASVAFRDGLSVANILSGKPGLPAPQAIPLTIDAGLEIATGGMTEKAAKAAGIEITVGRSPYASNGGAATEGMQEGFVKVVAEKATGRILGVHIVGYKAGDLIGEAMLAIETGARLEDVALTLHPHPELIELFQDACARAAGLSANTVKK